MNEKVTSCSCEKYYCSFKNSPLAELRNRPEKIDQDIGAGFWISNNRKTIIRILEKEKNKDTCYMLETL